MASNHQREWHYAEGGRNFGPYPESEIAKLIRFGPLNETTHVWTDGYEDWRLLGESDLAQYLPEGKQLSPEPPLQTPSTPDSPARINPDMLINQLKSLFRGMVLCCLSGAGLIYIAQENSAQYIGLGGVALGAVGMVGMLGLHYKLWVLLQGHGARTTPIKAVSFLFIPFFNLYWNFVSYYGLASDLTDRCNQLGLPNNGNATQLGLAAAVTNLVFVILNVFNLLPMDYQMISIILYFCLLTAFYNQVVKDATAVIQRQGAIDAGIRADF